MGLIEVDLKYRNIISLRLSEKYMYIYLEALSSFVGSGARDWSRNQFLPSQVQSSRLEQVLEMMDCRCANTILILWRIDPLLRGDSVNSSRCY
jgi:hypothetical protein